MSQTHLSANPSDPYQWRESVLSTRSLSYLSTTDAAASSPALSLTRTRSGSGSAGLRRAPRRRLTEMTDDSDYSLEMAGQRDHDLIDIPEHNDSVAESLLFRLPREIRDRIYTFCLATDEGIPIEWPSEGRTYGLQPQILQTCKAMYEEAGPLLYTLNALTFHHPSDANMFVRALASPLLAPHIQYLNLHIRAQDTRLWMPYIMSRDRKRSLEADFPRLRELHVRFRSNKWNHGLAAEANLKIWSEDSRLDELIDGLRNVFMPDGGPQAPKNERELDTFISNNPHAFPLDPRDPRIETQWRGITSARNEFRARQTTCPTIKVVCSCRVHTSHFLTLTRAPEPVSTSPDHHNDDGRSDIATNGSHTPPLTPHRPNAPFRGFTPVDLRMGGSKRLHDPDHGTVNVAQTFYADKHGILLSLEIHCAEAKKEGVVSMA